MMILYRRGRDEDKALALSLRPYIAGSPSFDKSKMDYAFTRVDKFEEEWAEISAKNRAEKQRADAKRAERRAFEKQREDEAYRAFAQAYSQVITEGNQRIQDMSQPKRRATGSGGRYGGSASADDASGDSASTYALKNDRITCEIDDATGVTNCTCTLIDPTGPDHCADLANSEGGAAGAVRN
ncbi:hypothetical protein GYB61_03730 [bacterium]|nr:hypothetical protein [bacterium]